MVGGSLGGRGRGDPGGMVGRFTCEWCNLKEGSHKCSLEVPVKKKKGCVCVERAFIALGGSSNGPEAFSPIREYS